MAATERDHGDGVTGKAGATGMTGMTGATGATTTSKETTTTGDKKKRRSYFCSACDFPSDVFGLLNPCQHVYCQSCAAQMSDCVICTERVDSVRVVRDMGMMVVSPLTLQGFLGPEGRRALREGLRGEG